MEPILSIFFSLVLLALLVSVIVTSRATTRQGKDLRQVLNSQKAELEELRSTAEVSRKAIESGIPTKVDLSSFLPEDALADLTHEDLVVYPGKAPDEVVVIGSPARARKLGEVIGPLPHDLAKVVVGADGLINLGIASGETSGMLVRLTAESTRKLKSLDKMRRGQATLGVLRDGSGKFRHVVAFTSVDGIQALSQVTGPLTGIAVQMQLASLKKSIDRVSEQVSSIQDELTQHAEASRRATETLVMEAYQVSQDTGTLAQSTWDQLAPLRYEVLQQHENAVLKLEHLKSLTEGLTSLSASEQRRRLDKIVAELEESLTTVQRTGRTWSQFQALRLWYLIETGDPGLDAYQQELGKSLERQSRVVAAIPVQIGNFAKSVGVSKFDRVFSPIDSRRVVARSQELAASYGTAARSILALPPGPSA